MKVFNWLSIIPSSKAKESHCASPHTQNEIINVGDNIIRIYLIDKISSTNNSLIMVDEITSFNKELSKP